MKRQLVLLLFCFLGSLGLIIAQTISVNGIVISEEDNEPVIGASILVTGTSIGTITDMNGKFSISNIPNSAKTLQVSFVGMKTMEATIKPGFIKIVLKADSEVLDEVVVTGLTKVDKRLFTGATDQLKAQDIKLDGVADISRALEGRSAGVSVQNVSGTFGTAPKILVRGATSIYGSSKPLWVVDGVIMEDIVEINADELSSGDAITLISSTIAGLNADDIEDFQILKDGSATSIYGARAMAGVIVITTKKGRPGISRISYTGEYSMRLKPSYQNFNILNSQEQMGIYQELRNKGWLNFAETARSSESGVYGKLYELTNSYNASSGMFGIVNLDEIQNLYLRQAEMRNTNWFDELFNTNIMHNHSVSISTGTEKASVYASLSAMIDPGWYKQSKTNRFTGNINTSYRIRENLTANLLMNASYRKQKAPGTLSQDVDAVNGTVKRDFDINPYSYALNSSRALDPNTYYTSNYAPFNIQNELDQNNMELNITNLKFQGELSWDIIPALKVSVLGALKYNASSQEHRIKDGSNQAMAYRAMDDPNIRDKNPLLYTDPDNPYALPISVLPQGGIYQRRDNKMLGYDFRASIAWNKVINTHHITNFNGGMEVNSVDRDQTFFNGWGVEYEMGVTPFYIYEFFKKGVEYNDSYYSITTQRNRSAAFYANPTYSYQGKYTLSGTVRYEGTNRLGKSKSARWLPTWNISGLWNVHEEKFFKSMNTVLSHLTLKASYSLTGDNPPGNVTNSEIIIKSTKTNRPNADLTENALAIEELENSELTYEKKHEFNIGAELGFLKNRINLVFDWYTRNNHDLIGLINTQGSGGNINKFANIADMKSQGVEFTLSTKNIIEKSFSWSTDLTFSYSKTKVTDLQTRTRAIDLITGSGFAMEGYPQRGLFSFRFGGLTEDGMPIIVDEKGDPITAEDINFQERENLSFLKYEGPTTPTVNGGLGNVFRYKNLRLNVFVTYAFGNKIRLDPVFKSKYNDLSSMPKEFKNRWMMSGDESKTNVPVIISKPQLSANSNLTKLYNAYNYTDVRIADGDFIRMKEISLTYDLPKRIISKYVESASVKLQATNLFLIYSDSKLNGQDPEFFRSGGVSAPVPKQFTMTLRLGF
ncbi:SusC/RagA family TonB-linked outer membrane protein [Bacteroides sp. 224]|uniref:SusC/RagA family TonB-linked outer membrane protein n=1 Tax=Bacteroides sp. 224 TaxID=2302936 RepID=UPI0013D73918|nr:SusC/RagA family TonB-linked outer membrane protein [Bacteroides sp. 224]NDV65741.1 SusC/RagA family TonB-linked outer membrane protein [Bacteroides sp. 224]